MQITRESQLKLQSASWTSEARLMGIWSTTATFGLAILYVPVLIAGFLAQGNFSDPLKDPYLAILELLILLMAPAMVMMMAAVHAFAARESKIFSLAALSFMVLSAGITTIVHFVLLTVGRQADLKDIPGYSQFFSWEWPSVIYALDVLAWDWFLGLSLLFATPVFRGDGSLPTWLRRSMAVAGLMCIAGLVGPAVGNIDLRLVGEVAYWFIFPAACLMLAIFFRKVEVDESRNRDSPRA